jgi:hypothetical protein
MSLLLRTPCAHDPRPITEPLQSLYRALTEPFFEYSAPMTRALAQLVLPRKSLGMPLATGAQAVVRAPLAREWWLKRVQVALSLLREARMGGGGQEEEERVGGWRGQEVVNLLLSARSKPRCVFEANAHIIHE